MRTIVTLLLVSALVLAALPVAAQTQGPTLPTGVAGDVLQRGADAAQAGDFDRAVLDFSLFLLLNPTDARGYFLRGMSYFSLEQSDAAIADMTRAVRYSEPYPELYESALATRAEFYALNGALEAALGDLDTLIDFRPTSESLIQRASLRMSGSAFEGAVSDLTEAIDLTRGEQPELYFYRAFAQSALQNQPAAARDYLEWINSTGGQTADQGALESGAALTLQMAQRRVYRIPLRVNRGDEMNILARNVAGDVDPLVVVLSPDGEPLVANDDARVGRDTNAFVGGYLAPVAGDYQLLVTHSISGYDGRVQVLFEVR